MTKDDKNPPAIAAIGSPSTSTEMGLDVLDSARSGRLVGSLVSLDVEQDGLVLRATGQITAVEMRNRWHEQDLMRNIIKMDGFLPHLSGRQDVTTAALSVGAVFGRADGSQHWGHEVLATVPAAGTPVRKLTQASVDELVEAHADQVFRLGRAYGDDAVVLPMYLKHFGDPRRGGQGEAYHSLIVGKTGSGKSTLAKFLVAGYARHEDMALMIVDPKGEFADEIAGYAVGDSGLPFCGILQGLGRTARRYGITQVRLETYELFEDVLRSLGLHRDLNIRGADNQEEMSLAIVEIVRAHPDLALDALRGKERLTTILETIAAEGDEGYVERIYKGKEGQDALRKEIKRILANPKHRIWATWDFLAFLFEKGDGGRPTMSRIVRDMMTSEPGQRPLIALDLSVPGNRRDMLDLGERLGSDFEEDGERDLFSEGLQKKVIYRIVSDMRRLAETIVSERMRDGHSGNVNALVVFEEAHRFAPRSVPPEDEDGKKLKAKLVEAVRETRKFGLGWMFVDQTIGGIEKEITQQVRCAYFGYGLSMGDELERLREIVGGDQRDMALYRSFKDPASYGSADGRRYPWMAFGPVSPMAANRPLFLNAFSGQEFSELNRLPVEESAGRRRPAMHLSAGGKVRTDAPRRTPGRAASVSGLGDLSVDDLSSITD